MQGLLLHADWLSDFSMGGPFPKVCFRKNLCAYYVHNHIPICTALLTGSLFWHLHRDNMVLVSATYLWILDLWDISCHHLSKLSGTSDNIHIWAASTGSTMRDAALKLSQLLAASSTLLPIYR